jgi:cation diffusion facilitator CzcD-associated flavoprotein CzcO
MLGQDGPGPGPQHRRVIIIGGGFGGVAMACQLKTKLRCTDFCVLERQSGIGGTWWINTYPGIACDMYVVSHNCWVPQTC